MEDDDKKKEELAQLIERVGLMHYGKSLRSKNKKILEWIMTRTDSLPETASLSERVYIVLNGEAERVCEHGSQKKFNTFVKGYRFCAHDCRCRREEQSRKMMHHHATVGYEEHSRRVEAQRQTMLERYGVENPMQVPEFRAAFETISLERFGHKFPLGCAEVQMKIQATNMERYGCHPSSLDETKEKVKTTNLDRYGSKHVMNIAKAAFAEQYGTSNPFDLPEFQAKAKETMVARYGTPHALCDPTIFNKMIADVKAKYGVTTVLMLNPGKPSLIGTAWLDSLNVPLREYYIELGMTSTKADGFDPSTNTVYAFHGDFWHGNPAIYDHAAINPRTGTPFGSLYETTIIRDDLVRQMGYNLVVMWEADWVDEYRRRKKCAQKHGAER